MQLDEVVSRILDLRRRFVEPIANGQAIDLVPESIYTARPMVLLLGNHSSGKSSLINHLVDQRIQRTGVAPTDDGFTVLMHGEDAIALDGQTLTSDPRLPMGGLGRFGQGLVQHLSGRRLPIELLRHVWLVDSPGMIDSGSSEAQRPYDFAEVVKWFAQRADLILLFFDPEKPGTTGETLTTLTESLAGVDDKLRIVMNKMDLFDGIRDFARTYGSLCWNLSRALPTKDLPHIYTTIIPELVRSEPALPLEGFASALLELEKYVADLPGRRPDKVLSTFMDECQTILMRTEITEALRSRVRRARDWFSLVNGLIATTAIGIGTWMLHGGFSWPALGLVAGGAAWLVIFLWVAVHVGRWAEVMETGRIDKIFQAVYRAQLTIQDQSEDLHHCWARIRPQLVRVLGRLGLKHIKRVPPRRIRVLRRLVDVELPALRE